MTTDSSFIELPAQRVPVIDRCNVLVVGGGSAGLAAAIAARRQGADVVLVERYGYLGGRATGDRRALPGAGGAAGHARRVFLPAEKRMGQPERRAGRALPTLGSRLG